MRRCEPDECPAVAYAALGEVCAEGFEVSTLVSATRHWSGRGENIRADAMSREVTAKILELVVCVLGSQLRELKSYLLPEAFEIGHNCDREVVCWDRQGWE